ncbi:aspartic peptidase domain-containing protein [Globomyces pollinis-pini]|nr:aspartic peptidase domain-containing protein [Globomyces pollinis-pini]
MILQVSNIQSNTTNEDGILGLGYLQGSKSLNNNLLFHTKLKPFFSYFIYEGQIGATITFGALDTNKFAGPLLWTNIIAKNNVYSHWTIKVSKVLVYDIVVTDLNLMIDTGTSVSLFENEIARSINSALNLTQIDEDSGLYGIQYQNGCHHLPIVSFMVNNQYLEFSPKDYIYRTVFNNSFYCISGFQGYGRDAMDMDGIHGIMGNILLQKYYTVFDIADHRIGWALADRRNFTNSSYSYNKYELGRSSNLELIGNVFSSDGLSRMDSYITVAGFFLTICQF